MNFGVLFDITTICPHKCIYCKHQREGLVEPKMMSKDTFDDILDVIVPEGFKRIILYMSGEPLAHPDFYYFLNECASRGCDTRIATKAGIEINFYKFSEACKLAENNFGFIKVTTEVPAWTQKTADKICHLDLNIQKTNLRRFASMIKLEGFKRISLITKTIVTKWNKEELSKIKNGLEKIGITRWSSRSPGYYMDNVNPSWKAKGYEGRISGKRKAFCPFPRNVAVSTEGNVSVCCHDMLFKINMGNVVEEGSLWKILVKNKDIMRNRLHRSLSICKECN